MRILHPKELCLLGLICLPALAQLSGGNAWKPEEWKPYAQRSFLMPEMEVDEKAATLSSSATGAFRINGAWRKIFAVQENAYYRVRAEYASREVELPRRSILVQVDWRDSSGKRVSEPEFPSHRGETAGGWEYAEATYRAPQGASAAILDLIFRWEEKGSVQWRNVSFEITDAPPPRPVVLATVNFRPRSSSGPQENIKLFGQLVERAGKAGADIVCLPEGITLVATGKSYLDVAEPVPGPTTAALGSLARKYHMYVVAGLLEKAGETAYNTAVLIGRDGQVAGKYRKVSLPREEIEGGLTPGDDFPVFQTDFGKIGIMICWDVHFPEPARRLAWNGAEIILMPIWGGIEPLFAARAIENAVYLVTSSYDARSGIWDHKGNLITEASENGSVAFYRVDLQERALWEWLGDFRARIPREAPPVAEIQ